MKENDIIPGVENSAKRNDAEYESKGTQKKGGRAAITIPYKPENREA